jgi:hypothetical protein
MSFWSLFVQGKLGLGSLRTSVFNFSHNWALRCVNQISRLSQEEITCRLMAFPNAIVMQQNLR